MREDVVEIRTTGPSAVEVKVNGLDISNVTISATVCTSSYQYNAMLSVPTGFAVGADRDGAVAMRCLLSDGWCGWEYEPEDNELTTEQFAQQAIAHVAEKHSPGA